MQISTQGIYSRIAKRLGILISMTLFIFIIGASQAHAGDDASGAIPYSVDLSQKFSIYSMTPKDNLWSASLLKRLRFTGKAVHFVRTSLPLNVEGHVLNGAVYQAVEKPNFFYVAKSDTILALNARWAYSPGVGGFSMHAPKSLNFIVCLYLETGGVPVLTSSRVQSGIVTWKGHDRNRLK